MDEIEYNQLMIKMKDEQIEELMNQNQKIIKLNMDLNMQLQLEKMKSKFLVESIPSPTESIPSPTESIPLPTESIPSPTESIPSPTESIPLPTESIPSPTESIPLPTHTIPSPTRKRIKHNLFLREQLKIFPGRKKEFKSRNYSALYKRIRNKLKVVGDKFLMIKKGKDYVQFNAREKY